MTLTGSEEVSLVIGAFPCTYGMCPGASEVMGDILYSGPYNPQLYDNAWNPYQNFSVIIPSWYNGVVQLGVAHFFLLGVCIPICRLFVSSWLPTVDVVLIRIMVSTGRL